MARSVVYRSRVTVQRDPALMPTGSGCGHNHRSLKQANDCLATRVREALGRPVIELVAVVEQSFSRHDWFPVRPQNTETTGARS